MAEPIESSTSTTSEEPSSSAEEPSSSSSTAAPTAIPEEVALVGKSLTQLPERLTEYGKYIIKLDLTNNHITSFSGFASFPNLSTLILDKNHISSLSSFPVSPSISTIWLNNNNISDLDSVLNDISLKFPSLTYLSMLRNPACPNLYESIGEAEAYTRYRYNIINRLPKLTLLDATPIDDTERAEAKSKGQLKVAKPSPSHKNVVVDQDELREREEATKRRVIPNQHSPKVASFLAKGKPRYDGTNSEGNRFIMNEDL